MVGAKRPRSPAERKATTWRALRANLRQFVTFEVPYAEVRVDVGGRSLVVTADREGYVDIELDDVRLPPGRHDVVLTPTEPAGTPANGIIHVADPAADIAVISDIDDTIIDSGISQGLLATVTTALLRDATTRVPLEGAPDLYRALAQAPGGGPERPFFYLSTSPWNLVDFLSGFIEQHDFPAGPMVLTDWGPGSGGLFRIPTREHKLSRLHRLAGHLPARFVLLGDSGQEDVEIYTAFALEHPGKVAAIYVRRAGLASPAKRQRIDRCARELAAARVPHVIAGDSAAMLRHAQRSGLVSAYSEGGA